MGGLSRVIPPTANHTHTLIYLHGYSYTAQNEIAELFDEYKLSFPNVRVVIPTARFMRITFNNQRWHSWFNYPRSSPSNTRIQRLIDEGQNDTAKSIVYSENNQTDMEASAAAVAKLIEAEAKEIGMENIILGGES